MTGRLFEVECLGVCKNVGRNVQYLSWKESMKEAMRSQPWEDPTDPEPRFARDLHYLVCEELGVDCSELKFYTSVGTSFDIHHGVDAFFVTRYSGKTYWVTLDLSLDYKSAFGADLLVRYADTVDGIREYAWQISNLFQRKFATI